MRARAEDRPGTVSAVILAYNRREAVETVLDRLASLPVDEVVVVDNGTDGTGAAVRGRDRVRVIEPDENVGIAGRNMGARAASGEFVLMLDDDSFPLPGALEILLEAFRRNPRLGAAGGLVRNVDDHGRVLLSGEVGTFDWLLRAGREGDAPPEGFAAFWFPEGGALFRRQAYLDAGGFFEPYFFTWSELDLTTRLLQRGWDVRYFPSARFDHMKPQGTQEGSTSALSWRIRNQIWYFWLRFPPRLAARRIPAYLLFDLIESTYRRVPGAWVRGIRDAWRDRDRVRPYRDPIPRSLVRRAEMNRGRMHLRLLWAQVRKKLLRR